MKKFWDYVYYATIVGVIALCAWHDAHRVAAAKAAPVRVVHDTVYFPKWRDTCMHVRAVRIGPKPITNKEIEQWE